MSTQFIGVISTIGFILYNIYYFKIVKNKIPYPLFIYLAMFPLKMRDLNIFFFEDYLLKGILICGMISIIYRRRKLEINKFELSFILVILISIVKSYIIGGDLEKLSIGFFNIGFILFFVVYAYNIIRTKTQFNAFMKSFYFNGVLLASVAIVEHFFLGIERAFASMNNANYLGFYLLVCLTVSLYLFYENKSIKKYFHFFLIILGIYSTGSFSVIIATCVVLLIKLTCNFNVNTEKISHIIGVLLFAINPLLLFFVNYNIYELGLIRRIIEIKDIVRIYVWENALEVYKLNPIVGIGYNQFSFNVASINEIFYVTHNDFIRILVELGSLGIIVLTLYVMKALKNKKTISSSYKVLFNSLICATITFSLFHNNINSLLFWLILSLPFYKLDNAIVQEE